MEEKKVKKIQTINEGLGAASGVLTLVSPFFSTIPLVIFVANRVIGLISDEDIIKRLKKIEIKLKRKKITKEDFRKKINDLSEHKRYVVSNNLQEIILNCIPETIDVYIEAFVNYVMNKDSTYDEDLCEIIKQLNKNDFIVLKMIKEYIVSGTKDEYMLNIEKHKQIERDNKLAEIKNYEINKYNETATGIKKLSLPRYVDRNIVVEKNKTIFWKDFAKLYNLENIEMGLTILFEAVDEKDEKNIEWAFHTKSFIKLERLGLIQMDYFSTLGTINSLNIDRFHITLFGELLLKYI